MTDIATLKALLERVEKCDGPDRELDVEIFDALGFRLMPWNVNPNDWLTRIGDKWVEVCRPTIHGASSDRYVMRLTSSIDAALALVEEKLPGWWWKVGTCSVSDDACVCPDFNDPVHGERLRERYFPIEHGNPYDEGFDVDRRPPGNPALALIDALLQALISEQERDAGKKED